MTEKFTVFSTNCYQGNYAHAGRYSGVSLQALAEGCIKEFSGVWVAWAPEWPSCIDGGGTKSIDTLRAESIAAGRIIKDGVAVIPAEAKEAKEQFRVGACYRDGHGHVFRLEPTDEEGVVSAVPVWDGYAKGPVLSACGSDHILSSGRWVAFEGGESTWHLLAGEVDPKGNPINAEKPATPMFGSAATHASIAARYNGAPDPMVEQALAYPDTTVLGTIPEGLVATEADLRMIAKDGAAKPREGWDGITREEPKPTAKPAISGLTKVAPMGHQFGLGKCA